MSKCHYILLTKTSFFISSAEKTESVLEFQIEVSTSCFIKDDRHVKIVLLHVEVFSKHHILHFLR